MTLNELIKSLSLLDLNKLGDLKVFCEYEFHGETSYDELNIIEVKSFSLEYINRVVVVDKAIVLKEI